jgi:hypothetical protein
MPIGLMQEQNAVLRNGKNHALNQMRSDAAKDDSGGLFTDFLFGTLIATTMSR